MGFFSFGESLTNEPLERESRNVLKKDKDKKTNTFASVIRYVFQNIQNRYLIQFMQADVSVWTYTERNALNIFCEPERKWIRCFDFVFLK